MKVEVKVPTPGESISEVELATWMVSSGDLVRKNQELAEIESDKATLSLIAPESGKIELLVEAGETVKVNAVACTIDTSVEVPDEEPEIIEDEKSDEVETKETQNESAALVSKGEKEDVSSSEDVSKVKTTPLAREKMAVENIRLEDILSG